MTEPEVVSHEQLELIIAIVHLDITCEHLGWAIERLKDADVSAADRMNEARASVVRELRALRAQRRP